MEEYMKRVSAFTLAEVLITLGILGVVMALTLPTLMGEYRKKTIEARLKKFYSASNQAIQQSEIKNGPKEYWEVCNNIFIAKTISCEDWYNLYLKDYLKTIRVEHFKDENYENTAAYFENGSLMVIKSGYDIYFYPFAKDFDKEKFFKQNEDDSSSRPDSGTKFFAFSFQANVQNQNKYNTIYKNKGIEPYRTVYCIDGVCNTLTHEELLNHTRYGCNKDSPFKSYCTALIQENNWEIPNDYPFKF